MALSQREYLQRLIDSESVFWISDPGHGWLAVPVSEVKRLGIAARISGYSYIGSDRKGLAGYALLEEDCDASVYLEQSGMNVSGIAEFYFDQPNSSRNVAPNVRCMDRFDASKL
jgi:hypothetical protein